MPATKSAVFPAGSILLTDYVNATRRERYGCEELNLADCCHCTKLENGSVEVDRGKLFKMLVKEYGKCTGKIYVDSKDGRTIHIGWAFAKRVQYDDCRETYLREVWATFATVSPRRVSHIAVA